MPAGGRRLEGRFLLGRARQREDYLPHGSGIGCSFRIPIRHFQVVAPDIFTRFQSTLSRDVVRRAFVRKKFRKHTPEQIVRELNKAREMKDSGSTTAQILRFL